MELKLDLTEKYPIIYLLNGDVIVSECWVMKDQYEDFSKVFNLIKERHGDKTYFNNMIKLIFNDIGTAVDENSNWYHFSIEEKSTRLVDRYINLRNKEVTPIFNLIAKGIDITSQEVNKVYEIDRKYELGLNYERPVDTEKIKNEAKQFLDDFIKGKTTL